MRYFLILVLCSWIYGATFVATAEEPKPAKPSVVMEKKLEYSQDILKALMNDDFDRLDRDVKLMQVFTRLEEMYRAKQPDYQEQFGKFRDSLSSLSKSVTEKNSETAARDYGNMVQSCIRCHQIIRNR